MKLLCVIEDVFAIGGRGCVVVPGVPYVENAVKGGSGITIETPKGHRLETVIVGLEMINRGRPMNHAPFLVPASITKDMLPIGSRVYLRDG